MTDSAPALEDDITQLWPSPMLLELGECLYKEWVHSDPMPGDKEWLELDDAEREIYCHFVKRIVDKYLVLTKQPPTGDLL